MRPSARLREPCRPALRQHRSEQAHLYGLERKEDQSRMKSKWLAISALTLSLGATSAWLSPSVYAAPAGSPSAAGFFQDGRWDEPPAEFREAQRQGFHDGIEGARKDYGNHRAPNVDNREEYRHPHIESSLRQDYREGFRRGYDKAMHHLMDDHHDRY